MPLPNPSAARLCLALLLVLSSTGCQSGSVVSRVADIPVSERERRADTIVAEAPRRDAAYQQRLLTAAMLYNSSEAYAKAIATLNRIDTSRLPREFRGDFIVAAADAALGTGDVDAAWQSVARAPDGRYPFIAELPSSDFARIAERRAAVLERRGMPSDALRERLAAGSQLSGEPAQANNEAIWAAMLRLDLNSLRQFARAPEGPASGWATLAMAWRESADSTALRAGRVNAWMQANAAHPAALQPPMALARLRGNKITELEVKRIAVLLPMQGKLASAGEAIRRGLLTAWYNAHEAGAQMPSLGFFDSSRANFDASYDEAVQSGAGLIIGPLEKENLKLLLKRASLPVPTLALNYPDGGSLPAGLSCFGLAGEDEGVQIARWALKEKRTNLAILHPAADWGQRIAAQIEQTLTEGGARIQARVSYAPDADFHDLVQRLFNIGAGESRLERVEKAVGVDLVFKPRRTGDIDGLFVIANTPQAGQILPALQYYQGDQIPILATSHVNSQPAASTGTDLAGIRFVEMPWFANADQPLRERARQAWHDSDDRYLRLYPLGVDALRIAQQLPGLAASPGQRIEGATGSLSMDADHCVRRELIGMVYRNGTAERLDEQP